MANFQDILNRPMDEIKPPNPLPPGEYLAIVDGQPEIAQLGKNQNHAAIFPVKLVQAINVDPTFQQAVVEALDGKALTDIKLRHTMWLTEDAAYRLKAFLQDHLGIKAANPAQAISEAAGKQLIVTLGHRVLNQEGEAPRIVMDIKGTAKA